MLSTGLVLGVLAVIFWSFGSSLIFLGAREVGTWTFVAVSSLSGGLLQLAFRRAHRGELRSALVLPWKLWAVPVACFVIYGLVWPCALVSSTPRQVIGVSLINYLWPVLTVVFSAWWVPGVKLTPRVVLALLLALAGLMLANLAPIRELLTSPAQSLLPYVLSLVAAFTWAIYSAVLVRWRSWACDYVTSPVGFILIGAFASVIAVLHGGFAGILSWHGGVLTLLYGAGPLAAGYLLWELALPKARVQALGVTAAVTPVLSTLLLCIFLKKMPGPELAAAALLVGGGVALSVEDVPGDSRQAQGRNGLITS